MKELKFPEARYPRISIKNVYGYVLNSFFVTERTLPMRMIPAGSAPVRFVREEDEPPHSPNPPKK